MFRAIRLIRNCLLALFTFVFIEACSQSNRHVQGFKQTDAYALAKAVNDEDLGRVEKLVKKNPGLLDIVSSNGSNVLVLCLYSEKFASFNKLLELGADPNFIDPNTKYSVLIEACKPFGSSLEWINDNRYAEVLLKKGANPNYAVEEDFTNAQGVYVGAISPLIRASALNIELVRMLVKSGADIDRRIGGETPFAVAVRSRKFDIIYYYIDSLKVDVSAPLNIRTNDSLLVQDYIKRFMNFEEGSPGDKKKLDLIRRLETGGVDFKNYLYKS